jgi:DNA (cytosine-5)-methyltransferase 1
LLPTLVFNKSLGEAATTRDNSTLMMQMIDLFSGAGGLSLGLEAAGFEAVLAVEMDHDACATYNSLFPRTNVLPDRVEKVDLRHLAGKVDLVAGGPPCQPFSSGGKRLAQDDHRDLLPEFLRAIREVRPPLFLMENVEGLNQTTRRGYLRAFLREVMSQGYWASCQVLYAADYGVPQKRRRLFIVGSKIGHFHFPPATHGPKGTHPYEVVEKYLSRDRVIGTPNTGSVVYAKNPDLRPSPYDGHVFNGGGRAINLASLCPTILASAGGNKTHFVDTLDEVPRYHAELLQGKPPREGTLPGGRRLTVEESAIIQTFPERVRFFGSRSSQYAQVGNAVPPMLAMALGQALLKHLLADNGDVEPQPHQQQLEFAGL